MKNREMWMDEAREFVGNWKFTSDQGITFEDVLHEVTEGWSAEVNYNGTPKEYACELWDAIQSVEE